MLPLIRPLPTRWQATFWTGGGILLFLLVLLLDWRLAHQPAWYDHLAVDLATFYQRAMWFTETGGWQGLTRNEYQPGALWFFAGVASLVPFRAPFTDFAHTFFLVTMLLLAGHYGLSFRFSHRLAPLWLVIILAATGPLLFFRFEALVSLLVLGSWLAFQRRAVAVAAGLLGIAVAIKIYPIILLPLFYAEVVRRRQHAVLLPLTAAFSVGVAVPLLLYLGTGGGLSEAVAAVNFHSYKPVGLESVWANLLTLPTWHNQELMRVTAGFGVHGFTPTTTWLTAQRLNSIWVPPTALVLLYLWWRFKKRGYTDALIPFTVLLVFVVFAKVLNPQYLWWFAVFFPFIARRWFPGIWGWVLVSLLAVILLLTQVVYPLQYTKFLDWFYGRNPDPTLFWDSVLRNVLLVVLLVAVLIRIYYGTQPKQRPREAH